MSYYDPSVWMATLLTLLHARIVAPNFGLLDPTWFRCGSWLPRVGALGQPQDHIGLKLGAPFAVMAGIVEVHIKAPPMMMVTATRSLMLAGLHGGNNRVSHTSSAASVVHQLSDVVSIRLA